MELVLLNIVGGIWADKVGGKLVLGFGVIWWSLATVLTPTTAKAGLPFLLAMHAFTGIGEGVAMPAMNNMLSKWVPVSERSRSLALVYSGMYLGSVTGLAFSPILIHKFGSVTGLDLLVVSGFIMDEKGTKFATRRPRAFSRGKETHIRRQCIQESCFSDSMETNFV